MKKSISVIILLITMCFILSGCVKREYREEVLEKLEKENYIKSDWKLIDTTTGDGLFGATDYLYIYKDSESKLYAVAIYADSKDEEKLYVSLYENTVQEKIAKTNIYDDNNDEDEEYTYVYERGNLVEKLVLKKGTFKWTIEKD